MYNFRGKHLEIRNGFDRLDRLTAKGPNHKEFIEPKVQDLWRIVLKSQFSPEERASLKVFIYMYNYWYFISILDILLILYFIIRRNCYIMKEDC